MLKTAEENPGVLTDRLKAKDPEAWRLLVERYEKPLLKIVRPELPRRIRARVDAEDVVQEVFRGVVDNVRRGDFRCDCDDQLWGILRARAAERLADVIRRHRSKRRDAARERVESAANHDSPTDQADRHPPPEQIAMARDELRTFVQRLKLREQIVVWLHLEYPTLPEIADALRCSLRTIQDLWEGICRKARSEAKKEIHE